MRILVVGAGAVGGFFGGRLVQAGRDVTFLVRPARAAALAEHGLRIHTLKGDDLTLRVNTVTAAELAAAPTAGAVDLPEASPPVDRAYDLVLLAVKAYGLEQAMADIAAAIGPDTIILPTLNGMRHIDLLRERFGAGHVIGGVCVVATQVDDDATIRQVAPGAALSYGEFDGSASERMLETDRALADAGFRTTLSATIEHDMWEKWMLLGAGGALTTLLRGTVGPIVAAPGGTETALAIVDETFAVAAAAGFPPRAEARDRVVSTLTEPGSGFSTSLYRDLVQGRAVEADQIVGDLVDRGRAAGLAVPLLTLAYTSLCVFEESRRAA
ncbi:ketopantoate reductase family protein [Subtercola sp. YIM 133946]|uniref:ketopantoate reductase family protein n=1 Tax=Subtercola sp. YIM 133946 TaxID=3118909 RepID=UPI002F93D409